MMDKLQPSPIFQYDHHYSFDNTRHPAKYVTYIERDKLMADLIHRLAALGKAGQVQ